MEEGHALGHPVALDAPLGRRLERRLVLPRVHARQFLWIADLHGHGKLPGYGRHGIREVVLLLGVVVGQALEGLLQGGPWEGVGAAVHALDRQLFRRGVLGLNHRRQAAVRMLEHPAVRSRGLHVHGQQQGLRRAEPGHRGGRCEGDIAAEDDHF